MNKLWGIVGFVVVGAVLIFALRGCVEDWQYDRAMENEAKIDTLKAKADSIADSLKIARGQAAAADSAVDAALDSVAHYRRLAQKVRVVEVPIYVPTPSGGVDSSQKDSVAMVPVGTYRGLLASVDSLTTRVVVLREGNLAYRKWADSTIALKDSTIRRLERRPKPKPPRRWSVAATVGPTAGVDSGKVVIDKRPRITVGLSYRLF